MPSFQWCKFNFYVGLLFPVLRLLLHIRTGVLLSFALSFIFYLFVSVFSLCALLVLHLLCTYETCHMYITITSTSTSTHIHAHYNNNQTLNIIENAEEKKTFSWSCVCVCRYFDYEPRKNANVKRKKGCAMPPEKNLCQKLSFRHIHTHRDRGGGRERENRREIGQTDERRKWQNVTNVDLKSNNEKRFFISDKDSLFNQIDFKWKQLDDDAILACLPAVQQA